jgi:DNA-binding SARP family transcriptional activator
MDSQPPPLFRTLGPLEVTAGGRRVPIRSTKQRILLASLLLNANGLVTVDELIDRLWAHPPSDARGTAQVHLGRLRRTLAASGVAAGRLIRTDTNGYVIEVSDDDLDLARFVTLVERARREDDARREVVLLRDALALWRGRPLSNVPSDHVQRSDVPRLVEQRLRTAERRFELELELDGGGDMIGELRELATAEPFRERLWALLMKALYRQGRQREALECYHACAAALREEIGLDPGQELHDLHQAILRRAVEVPGPHRDARGPAARWEIRPDGPCQLPPEIGDFVGRAAELRAIAGHFADRGRGTVPIVAVVGSPGVGKTVLAVKAAHALRERFPGGQLYVRLGGSTGRPRDPLDALGDLLDGLGEPAARHGDLDGRAAMLRERLADRRILLVVDDVADAGQATAVLPGTHGCGVLLTSRQRLVDLPGVERVRPGPLAPQEALAFLERLIGAGRVDRERAVAEEISELCGRLPLALRIVGARLALRPSQTLARLAASLRDETRRLDELATQDIQMRTVLDASYAALDPRARALLRRLGALGGCEFVEATALALAGGDGIRALDRLVEANLVEPVETGGGESRYRLCGLVGIHASQYRVRES